MPSRSTRRPKAAKAGRRQGLQADSSPGLEAVRSSWGDWIKRNQPEMLSDSSELIIQDASLDTLALSYLQEQWDLVSQKNQTIQRKKRRTRKRHIKVIRHVKLVGCTVSLGKQGNGEVVELMGSFFTSLGNNLKHLTIEDSELDSEIHFGDESLGALVHALKRVPSLQTLEIHRAPISSPCVFRAIQELGSVSKLLLGESKTSTPEVFGAFLEAMKHHPGLTHLSLECWELDDEQLAQLADVLANSASKTTLEELDLSGVAGATSGAFSSLACLLENLQIKSFDVSYCLEFHRPPQTSTTDNNNQHEKTQDPFKEFLEALKANHTLQTLDLTVSRLGSGRAYQLLECYQGDNKSVKPALRHLGLRVFGALDGERVAALLPSFCVPELEVNVTVVPSIAIKLVEALSQNTCLTYFDAGRTFGCSWYTAAVERLLRRNQFLQRVPETVLGAANGENIAKKTNGQGAVNRALWSHCLAQFGKQREREPADASPVFAFLRTVSPDLALFRQP